MRPRFQVGIRTCSLMGDFGDPLPRSLMTSLPRQCVRCGCALRYGNTETRCAPCAEALRPAFVDVMTLHPPVFERTRPVPNGLVCECGALKSDTARHCMACYRKATARPDGYGGRVCPECGGRKANTARMCRLCRYPSLRGGALDTQPDSP